MLPFKYTQCLKSVQCAPSAHSIVSANTFQHAPALIRSRMRLPARVHKMSRSIVRVPVGSHVHGCVSTYMHLPLPATYVSFACAHLVACREACSMPSYAQCLQSALPMPATSCNLAPVCCPCHTLILSFVDVHMV